MNYKYKYLKYKKKYFKLLDEQSDQPEQSKQLTQLTQLGGNHETIPNVFPRTYSFLFMPLIYYAIDKNSVELPEQFIKLANECIENAKAVVEDISFDNFDKFITYLNFILHTNRINSIESINKFTDSNYHIPGTLQETITNYNVDDSVNMIISCLANILVEKIPGQKFIYKF